MSTQLKLPRGLLDSIAHSSPPRVLLLRHADREDIEPGHAGARTPLTARGERRALTLRDSLGSTPEWGVSSPLLRCTRTAELLGVNAGSSALLGAPGCFIIDEARGGQVFGEHGVDAVVRGQLLGQTWGCMRPLEEGARSLLERLLEHSSERGGTGIAISHDAIVMPLISWVTGERFIDDWLAPLDGIVLMPHGGVWRGHEYPFAL